MQWSKLRQMFRELICDDLRDRVDVHMTRYHDAHDEAGEVWITVDGHKILDAGEYKYWGQWHRAFKKEKGEWNDRYDNAKAKILTEGIHDRYEFNMAIESYLQTDPHQALHGSNPLHQAFAIIDRRIGKRALHKLVPIEHPLVFDFMTLRALVS